jgi:hypothetical protein
MKHFGHLENESDAIDFEYGEDSSIDSGARFSLWRLAVGHTEAFRRAPAGVFTIQPMDRISQPLVMEAYQHGRDDYPNA